GLCQSEPQHVGADGPALRPAGPSAPNARPAGSRPAAGRSGPERHLGPAGQPAHERRAAPAVQPVIWALLSLSPPPDVPRHLSPASSIRWRELGSPNLLRSAA